MFSKEQIEKAKQIDLLSYLQSTEPGSLKRVCRETYCLAEHDSFRLYKGKWRWFSRDIGGKNALDYLIKVRGMTFAEAVQTLIHERAPPHHRSASLETAYKEKDNEKPFILPKPNRCGFRAVQYLLNRGIDHEIISRCLSEGSFYESTRYHNCVFVGRDKENVPRYASFRSTEGRFMYDIAGSDKRFGFTVPNAKRDSDAVLVFESAIDALSQASIDKIKRKGGEWEYIHRLSLGCTAEAALFQFLKDNRHVRTIYLCLDNDKPGKEAAERIKAAVEKSTDNPAEKYKVIVSPPLFGKDYNDTLKKIILLEKGSIYEKINSRNLSGINKKSGLYR